MSSSFLYSAEAQAQDYMHPCQALQQLSHIPILQEETLKVVCLPAKLDPQKQHLEIHTILSHNYYCDTLDEARQVYLAYKMVFFCT